MVQDRIYNYFERNPQLHVLFIFDKMNIIEEWQAANPARSALYRWFADIFARELTSATLDEWQQNKAYDSIHKVFVNLGLEQHSNRVKAAIDNLQQFPQEHRAIELAADFAQIFLLSGDDSAPPYASYYLSSDKHLYGKPAAHMMRFLDSQQLSLHPEFREPNDHLSVYFIVMSLWINKAIEQQLVSEGMRPCPPGFTLRHLHSPPMIPVS